MYEHQLSLGRGRDNELSKEQTFSEFVEQEKERAKEKGHDPQQVSHGGNLLLLACATCLDPMEIWDSEVPSRIGLRNKCPK